MAELLSSPLLMGGPTLGSSPTALPQTPAPGPNTLDIGVGRGYSLRSDSMGRCTSLESQDCLNNRSSRLSNCQLQSSRVLSRFGSDNSGRERCSPTSTTPSVRRISNNGVTVAASPDLPPGQLAPPSLRRPSFPRGLAAAVAEGSLTMASSRSDESLAYLPARSSTPGAGACDRGGRYPGASPLRLRCPLPQHPILTVSSASSLVHIPLSACSDSAGDFGSSEESRIPLTHRSLSDWGGSRTSVNHQPARVRLVYEPASGQGIGQALPRLSAGQPLLPTSSVQCQRIQHRPCSSSIVWPAAAAAAAPSSSAINLAPTTSLNMVPSQESSRDLLPSLPLLAPHKNSRAIDSSVRLTYDSFAAECAAMLKGELR